MDRKINFLDTSLRSNYKKHITNKNFDVLIIGGGITGAGICLDAASRGLSVCLIEMNDFASGTSSKSTKLIHGGLRYLEQFKFRLVHETGSERAILHNLAPHIVKPEKMLLPIVKNGKLNKFSTRAALLVYDYLANVKGNDRNKVLTKSQMLNKEPLLKNNNLLGGAVYSEYRTDDSRLTIDLIKKSIDYGACPINYIKGEEFTYSRKGSINGIKCSDKLSDNLMNINSKVIINASGSWTDEVLKGRSKKLVLSKGIHVVVSRKKFNINQSLYFDAIDSRMIFAIPRGDTVYIGTTDTKFEYGKDKLHVLESEVEYLIESVKNTFSISMDKKDIISSWVGLRPLVKDGNKKVTEISRKDEIFISEKGLITIAGGKLTGYRKMAQRAVDCAIRSLKIRKIKSKTKSINLFTYDEDFCRKKFNDNGISDKKFKRLYNIYGDGCLKILEISKQEKISDNFIIAEYLYVRRNEMCHTLLDFFSQRNSGVYFEIDQIKRYVKILENYIRKNNSVSKDKWEKEKLSLQQYISKLTTFI